MRKLSLALCLLLTLAACQKRADRSPVHAEYAPPAPAADAAAPAAAAPPAPMMRAPAVEAPSTDVQDAAIAPPPQPQADRAAPIPAGAPMMAYSYTYGVEADPSRIRDLETRHEHACASAGPTNCVVTSSEVNEDGRDRVNAKLAFRATPAWLAGFRGRLDKDAGDAGGRVTRAVTTSEDLSRQIVDTEADLRAKTTLRDRLQQILATHPGKMSDLVEVEDKLAEVQGEIDTTNSELAMMRQKVATSAVEIDYGSVGVLAPQGVLSPLRDALSDFVGIVVQVLAFMVRLVAVLAPWVLLLAGLFWLFRKRLPRPRWPFGPKAEKKTPPLDLKTPDGGA